MKIAIVGGGTTGITLAWLLSSIGEVEVYEKNNWLGGSSGSINYAGDTKLAEQTNKQITIERSHNCFFPTYHRNLASIFEYLDIYTEPRPTSCYCGGENPFNVRSLPNHKINFKRYSFWSNRDIKSNLDKLCNFMAAHYQAGNHPINLALQQYINSLHLTNSAIEQAISPLIGITWNYPAEEALNLAADKFMNFLNESELLTSSRNNQMHCIPGGFNNYVNKVLFKGDVKYQLNNPVMKIKHNETLVVLTDSNKKRKSYDRVIFTCGRDEMLDILDISFEGWRRAIEKLDYYTMPVFVHQDSSLLSGLRNNIMGYQIHSNRNKHSCSYHYNMSMLSDVPDNFPLFLSINPPHKPHESKVLYQTTWQRMNLGTVSQQAIKHINELQGSAGISYCSDYLNYDTSPMTGGINAAVAFAKKLGIPLPFQVQ